MTNLEKWKESLTEEDAIWIHYILRLQFGECWLCPAKTASEWCVKDDEVYDENRCMAILEDWFDEETK